MTKKMKFKYIFKEDYNPKYANGAYGGITPQGEIVVNFYFERIGLPKSQEYDVDEEGALSKDSVNVPVDLQSSMVRVVETGVALNLKSAKSIVSWLNEKIEILEKHQG